MNDEIFIQLFWFIFFVTSFCAALVIGAIFFHQFERLEYHRLIKLERARKAWAKMLNSNP